MLNICIVISIYVFPIVEQQSFFEWILTTIAQTHHFDIREAKNVDFNGVSTTILTVS